MTLTIHTAPLLYLIVAAITMGYIIHKTRFYSLGFILLASVILGLFWPVFWLFETWAHRAQEKPDQ